MKKITLKIVAKVPSRSSRRIYKILRNDRGLVCPCLAFRFAPGVIGSRTKRCRHMDEAGL